MTDLLPPDPLPPAGAPDRPRRWRRPRPAALGWGGFALFLVLLVAYLVGPTLRYGAKLSPPGPAAWDQPQPAARPAPAPARAPPAPAIVPAAAAENDATAVDTAGTNATAAADAAPADPGDEAELRAAIDRARDRTLDTGRPKHWEGGGQEGYVTASEPAMDGAVECRNVVVSVIADAAQPRSSTERWCRADEDEEWQRR